MQEAEAYGKACQIADRLLARGFPVLGFDSVSDMIIVRFGGARPQTVHAAADDATMEGFAEAYERSPP